LGRNSRNGICLEISKKSQRADNFQYDGSAKAYNKYADEVLDPKLPKAVFDQLNHYGLKVHRFGWQTESLQGCNTYLLATSYTN
jgi:hypothetical protein